VLIVVQRLRAHLGLYAHLLALRTDGGFDNSSDRSVVFHPMTGLGEADLVPHPPRTAGLLRH